MRRTTAVVRQPHSGESLVSRLRDYGSRRHIVAKLDGDSSARAPYDTMPRMPSARRALLLASALFLSYAYFYEGGGWNQNTRFDLVRAVVEDRTVRIDVYHENTLDKSHVGTHYYMDKAPGASLVAVPAVGLVRAVM